MNDDLISRKAAIEIVEGYNKSHMLLNHQPMLGAASIIIELNDLPSAQPEPRWMPVSERQPDKPGVYWVTVFNREWNKEGTDIVQGAKPPKDEYWDVHKNLYAVRQDGKWVVAEQRVWTGECWSGYGEIQLAWMEMPAPYTEEDDG